MGRLVEPGVDAAAATGSGSREPRRPAGGGLGTDSASRPSFPPPIAARRWAACRRSRSRRRGQSVSPPPPAGAEPVSSLGRIRRCGVFFRTAELGEVGCLTRVDVSPTVGVAEGAGGGTPGCPAVVPELRVHDAGDRDGGAHRKSCAKRVPTPRSGPSTPVQEARTF